MEEFKRYAKRSYEERMLLKWGTVRDLAVDAKVKNEQEKCTETNILMLDILNDIIDTADGELDYYYKREEPEVRSDAAEE